MKLLPSDNGKNTAGGFQMLAVCLLLLFFTGCADMNAMNRVRDINDQALLAKIAVEDENPSARHVATDKLTDQALLAKIAVEDKAWFVRCAAVNNTALKNQTLLARIAGNDEEFLVRRAADSRLGRDPLAALGLTTTSLEKVARTTDQTALAKIARGNEDALASRAAIDKLIDQKVARTTDQTALAKIAMEDEFAPVRQAAVGKLTDQALLAKMGMWIKPELTSRVTDEALLVKISKEALNASVRQAAVENKNLNNQILLANIAEGDREVFVRKVAVGRLTDQSVLGRVIN